jgi:hypothetical protein
MKEAYYFSHDSNARSDAKIIKLRRKYGMEGYGIYFALIEMLREDSAHKLLLDSFEDIAYDLRVEVEKIQSIVTEFDLFVVDNNYFYSPRLSRSMQKYYEVKNKRANSGAIGGKKKSQNTQNEEVENSALANEQTDSESEIANAKQMLSKTEANGEQKDTKCLALKERKGKERKEKESKGNVVVPPTIDEVIKYFIENGYTEEAARKAYGHYTAGDWHDMNGKKVKNWKQKMNNVWFKEENKAKPDPKDEIEKYRGMRGFRENQHVSAHYWFRIETDELGEKIKYYAHGVRP